MEFGFTKEQDKLRKEVHEFFINELPVDYQGYVYAWDPKLQAHDRALEKRVAERGWLAANWPRQYGGLGLSEMEQAIINEETGYWGRVFLMWPDAIGIHLTGPSLLLFGTEEQKRKFLPPIARGEIIITELFTEPDAGSETANVQLRAVPDGDYFVFNGQKTFVSEAYKPDYLYTLVRTADVKPKHRGLTLFLIPAHTPGITYRRMPVMSGQMKNEIFFDDVRVHKEYMLGELNRGFYHAMVTLEFERTYTGMASGCRRDLEEFVQYCKDTRHNGKPLFDDPKVRDALARIRVDLEIFRLTIWRTAWRFSQREKLGPTDYDLSGYFRKILPDRHCEAMMNIMGLYGQLRYGSKWSKLGGSVERRWQRTRSSHGAGTTEILKIVLAERGLGLPRKH